MMLTACALLAPTACKSGAERQLKTIARTSEPKAGAQKQDAPSSPGRGLPRTADEPCGMPAQLVARGWPRRLLPTTVGEPPAIEQGAKTLVILPDTQYYVACRSKHLRAQMAWVAAHAARRNIRLAVTVGDLTEHNSREEWAFFRDALAPISSSVPLILTTGNHDHGEGGSARVRGSLFREVFPSVLPATAPLLVETERAHDIENAYYRLPFGEVTLGVLALGWSPPASSVQWARGVLARYGADRKMFATHAYLYHDGTRYDWERYGERQEWSPRAYGTALLNPANPPGAGNWAESGAYDGEMLWQGLLRQERGLFLTVSGHVLGDGQGRLNSAGAAGNVVSQMLVNFQMLDEGGLGYLRLLEVSADGTRLRAYTYSPSLNLSATAADMRFDSRIEPPLR